MAVSRNKADTADLPGRVAAILNAARITAGSHLCVALSGGVDSVVVLHALAVLREQRGLVLSAAYVDHGLSPNAGHWRAHCERLCAALKVPFTSLQVTVERDASEGLEAAARKARHAALASVAADWMVFGHHQDDQAETVLFRLLRGTGVRGAAAMTAIEPGRLRPLLATGRVEIVAWAKAHDLAWVEDESNADPRFTRNFLRQDILPRIATAFPSASRMLARAATNFREADELLVELAALDGAACGGEPWRLSALKTLSEPRLRNLLRARIHALGLDAPPRVRLMEAVRQMRDSDGSARYLPLGAAAGCVYRGEVWVEPAIGVRPRAVRWRCEQELPWGAGTVRFVRGPGAGLSLTRLKAADAVMLDVRTAALQMRSAAGRPRHSFKNLCQEAGVPPWLREVLPVLYADGEPLWIAGVGISADACVVGEEEGVLPVWERWAVD